MKMLPEKPLAPSSTKVPCPALVRPPVVAEVIGAVMYSVSLGASARTIKSRLAGAVSPAEPEMVEVVPPEARMDGVLTKPLAMSVAPLVSLRPLMVIPLAWVTVPVVPLEALSQFALVIVSAAEAATVVASVVSEPQLTARRKRPAS